MTPEQIDQLTDEQYAEYVAERDEFLARPGPDGPIAPDGRPL